MTTSPQRRHRIRQTHQLRQRGHTLRQIAQHLNVSHSTISEDLALRELERATDRIKNQSTNYPLDQFATPDQPDHDRTNPTKSDHDHPHHDRPNPTKPDHDHPHHDRPNPTKPDHDHPLHARPNPTKPDQDHPHHDRPNPTTINPSDQIRTRPKQPVALGEIPAAGRGYDGISRAGVTEWRCGCDREGEREGDRMRALV